MQDRWTEECAPRTRSYRTGGGVMQVIGILLIAGGLLLLFLCIPGWFWAALAGAALILLGALLLNLGRGR